MRGPYLHHDKVTAKDPKDSIVHISDGDNFTVCECYGLAVAKHLTTLLNRDWLAELGKPTIDIIRAGVRLSGRAATTAKAKTGGTQKRRAAKRNKGTADARAVDGSNPSPGFPKSKLRNVRYYER